MALEGWDWFIKLAENENFTKAADELQISQQTLSARLVSLERNLGAKLVVRGTPISLTSAGKVFLLYAREQCQAQQDMIRQIGEVAGGGAGVLKVGISHTRGSYLMPKVIHRLSEELPAVTVKLIVGCAGRIGDSLSAARSGMGACGCRHGVAGYGYGCRERGAGARRAASSRPHVVGGV